MKKLEFTVAFIEEAEGGFTAIVEELPGAISYGETLEEARENIPEAIQLVLESNRDLIEKHGCKKHNRAGAKHEIYFNPNCK